MFLYIYYGLYQIIYLFKYFYYVNNSQEGGESCFSITASPRHHQYPQHGRACPRSGLEICTLVLRYTLLTFFSRILHCFDILLHERWGKSDCLFIRQVSDGFGMSVAWCWRHSSDCVMRYVWLELPGDFGHSAAT